MAGDSEIITQDEIEELLRQAQAAARGVAPGPAKNETQSPVATANSSSAGTAGQDEIEAMLRGNSAAAGKGAAAASATMEQDDIEAMLRGSAPAATKKAAAQTTAPPAGKSPAAKSQGRAVTDDITYLLNQAEEALSSVDQPVNHDIPGLQPFSLHDFGGTPASTEKATLDLLGDVELDVTIELGRTHMQLEEVLRLRRGSVVLLEKLAGDPVEIYVNERLVARGEVLVLNDNFCVRVAELIAGEEPKAA